MKIVIIGGGIAGLASACREAAKGHKVVLLEQQATLGGKIAVVQKGGYTWDAGPSFFTDPKELDDLFIDCGKSLEEYFTYFELEEACRYFYDDDILHGYDTPEKLASEFERVFGEPTENTLRFLEDVNKIYTHAGEQFLNEPVSRKSLLSQQTLRSLRNLPIKSISMNLHQTHTKYFQTQRAVQFFDRFATYVGANQHRTPGLLMGMPQLEHNQGAVQPKGGMREIIQAVEKLARELGVDIRTSQKVVRIKKTDAGYAITANKKELMADTVINAGDIANFYTFMEDNRKVSHERKEHSLSGYVQYLGVRGKTEDLYLHNVLFSKDYDKETRSLWAGETYKDPTIYINNTSYYEKNDAPKGNENWFVMVNLPAGFDESMISDVKRDVWAKLEKQFPGFSSRVRVEADALTPIILEEKFGAYKGSIYGLAANSIRGAFLRPGNKDPKYEGIYHVGVTVHPGGGIPLALRSAKIMSKMIG